MGTPSNRRFGRYEVLDEIGHGAMGVVYRARDPKINRVVAIKSISIDKRVTEAEADVFRQRFLREAEAAGRLSHPGIVTIFDVAEEPDTHDPYIVMEWIKGKSLEQLLQEKGKLAVDDAMRLVAELAEALDCAHGQSVIHRDLKPANILITEDGHPKIADFGVAKLNLGNLTMHGEVWGTPAFMSPEQLQGEAVDGRSDIFSLGVILYTLLTGHGPFQGNSAITVSFKVVNHEPLPAGVFDLTLPPGIDHVLTRAMAKDPAARYQRAMEMSLDLQNIVAGREPWSKAKLPHRKSHITGTTGVAPTRYQYVWAALQSWTHAVIGNVHRHKLAAAVALMAAFGIVLAAATLHSPSGLSGASGNVSLSPASNQPETTPANSALSATGAPGPPHSGHASTGTPEDSASSKRNALMYVRVEYPFQQGNVSIWVDDQPILHDKLTSNARKKLGFLGRGHSHQSEQVHITSGAHRVRIRVRSEDRAYDKSQSVSGDFATGTPRTLEVKLDRHGELNASLK